jgi:hypothetical protein
MRRKASVLERRRASPRTIDETYMVTPARQRGVPPDRIDHGGGQVTTGEEATCPETVGPEPIGSRVDRGRDDRAVGAGVVSRGSAKVRRKIKRKYLVDATMKEARHGGERRSPRGCDMPWM